MVRNLYSIRTEVCGNPDYGQDPSAPPYGVHNVILSAFLFDLLQSIVRYWIDENDIGGGNWMTPAVRRNGVVIGYMSYNGVLWKDQQLKERVDISSL